MPSINGKKDAAPSLETMFILDQCAAIETRCGDIYRHFASLFPDRPELSTLWKKTAHEEDHHAMQFQMLGRLRGDGITGVNADMSSVTGALNNLEALFGQIKGGKVSAIDSLKVGIRLEKYLSQYHANSIAVCDDPEMKRLLDSMMTCDLEHVARLEKALENLQNENVGVK